MRHAERPVKFKDPFKRNRWVPVMWCVVLVGALVFGGHKYLHSEGNYYASLETAAGGNNQ